MEDKYSAKKKIEGCAFLKANELLNYSIPLMCRNQHYAATGLASFPKEMTTFFKRNLCFRILHFLENSNLSLSHKSN